VRKADNLPPSSADVTESGTLNLPEPYGPHRPAMGMLYLYLYMYYIYDEDGDSKIRETVENPHDCSSIKKLTVTHLAKKIFLLPYGIWKLTIAFATASHSFLSQVNRIHPLTPNFFTNSF
jgi:hypothetical protein